MESLQFYKKNNFASQDILSENENFIFSVKKLSSKDEKLIQTIILYEKKIFGEGAIDIWNLKPYIKYGNVMVLLATNKETQEVSIVSCSEVLMSFDRKTAYIYGFFTTECFQAQGYGQLFLGYNIDYLFNLKISSIELTVSPNNESAIHLYQKLGFTIQKELPREYGINEDRLLMVLSKKCKK